MGKKARRNAPFHARQRRKAVERQRLWSHRKTMERADKVYNAQQASKIKREDIVLVLANGEPFEHWFTPTYETGTWSVAQQSTMISPVAMGWKVTQLPN